MKHNIIKSMGAVLFAGTLLTTGIAVAQTGEVTSTTVTSLGTISEFGPDRLIIKTESSPDPVRYTYTKTTTYVDEAGAPVSMETVKSGLPVTVHYTKVGDNMVASKVIVRKTTVGGTSPVMEKKETKTTTTTE